MKNLQEEARKRIGLLRRLRGTTWGTSYRTLRLLYTGLVRSRIDYSLPLLGSASDKTMFQLEVVQNSALRLMCGALGSTPASALEILADVEPLQIRRSRRILLEAEWEP